MIPRALLFAPLFVAALPASAGIWETANIKVTCSTSTSAQDAFGIINNNQGGTFPALLAAPLLTFNTDSTLPSGAGAFAFSEATHSLTPSNALWLYGSVWSNVLAKPSLTAAAADSQSGYIIQFDLPGDATCTFPSAFLSSSAFARITDHSGATIVSFEGSSSQPSLYTGVLPAGSYQLDVGAHTSNDLQLDQPLHRTAAYAINLLLTSVACTSDLNSDWQVDDFDFESFALSYSILECANEDMPRNCPGDLNGDEVVDDADFTLFAVAYDALVCS